MTEEMREQRIKTLREFTDRVSGWIEDSKKELARLEAAAPVKHPVIALIPCKWEEAKHHPKYADIHYGVHEDGATGYFPNGRTDYYPVRRVELCTDVQELRRRAYEAGMNLTIPEVMSALKAIGLPVDVK